MLTQILDQWEVLVELQRQQTTWQQRWDRAQAEFQHALQQLDPRDADRLARVLAESLPPTFQMPALEPNPAALQPTHQASASDNTRPTADPHAHASSRSTTTRGTNDPPTAAPASDQTSHTHRGQTHRSVQPQPTNQPEHKPGHQIAASHNYPTEIAPRRATTDSDPILDEAAIFADDTLFAEDPAETPAASTPSESRNQSATALHSHELPPEQQTLLQWATDTIGDGITENELFQAMRKSPFAGQARLLFELLRERDAFYETDDEAIHVHSLRKIAEYQNT